MILHACVGTKRQPQGGRERIPIKMEGRERYKSNPSIRKTQRAPMQNKTSPNGKMHAGSRLSPKLINCGRERITTIDQSHNPSTNNGVGPRSSLWCWEPQRSPRGEQALRRLTGLKEVGGHGAWFDQAKPMMWALTELDVREEALSISARDAAGSWGWFEEQALVRPSLRT